MMHQDASNGSKEGATEEESALLLTSREASEKKADLITIRGKQGSLGDSVELHRDFRASNGLMCL